MKNLINFAALFIFMTALAAFANADYCNNDDSQFALTAISGNATTGAAKQLSETIFDAEDYLGCDNIYAERPGNWEDVSEFLENIQACLAYDSSVCQYIPYTGYGLASDLTVMRSGLLALIE